MRYLVLILGLVLAIPASAFAKPKIAVAPFKGDKNNKVAEAIAEALAEQAKVTDPKATGKAIKALALGSELDNDEAKKLRKKLEVDAIVQGKLDKDAKGQTLKIAIFVKGKEPARFTVQFKTTSVKFRDDMRDVIMKKVESDDGKVASNDDDDDKKRKKDDDDKKKKDDDDKKKDEDDKRKRKKDDDDNKKRVAKRDDDGDAKVRRRKRKDADVEETTGPRKTAARVDVGAFAGVRRLTYAATMGPRPVGTFTRAMHVEGEIYPFAFGDQKSAAATGFGLALEYEKTVGLAITIPGTTTAVPINQSHYAFGARFRIAANPTTQITLGLDYMGRRYVADRSALTSPGALDAPDVDYKAVFPNVSFRKAFSAKAAFFLRGGGLAILDTGTIQERDQYGAATVYGFDLRTGLDFAITERIALRLAGQFNQISFKFKGNGDLAMARGVEGAADRNFGLATLLGVTY